MAKNNTSAFKEDDTKKPYLWATKLIIFWSYDPIKRSQLVCYSRSTYFEEIGLYYATKNIKGFFQVFFRKFRTEWLSSLSPNHGCKETKTERNFRVTKYCR